MRNFYLTLCFLFVALAGSAQTTIWLGGSSDWNDPANWSDGIPASGFTVTIPANPPNGINFPVYDGSPLIDYTIQIFGGSLTIDAVVYNTGNLLNSGGGSIVSNQIFVNAGMVQFNNNDGSFINNGVVDNYGTFTNAGTSTLTNTAGNTFNNYGDIENFGLITNDGTFLNTGDIISTATFVNNGTLTNKGFMDSAFGSTLTNSNGATFTNNAGAIFESNGAFGNAGAIVSDGSVFIQTASVVENSGSFMSNGAFDLSGRINNTGTFTNNPDMLINDSGVFNNENVFTNNGTITLTICGQIIQNAANNIGGTILNDGIIYVLNGSVTVTSNLDFGSEFTDLSQKKAPDTKCRSGIGVFLDENGNGVLDVNLIDKNSFGFCGANLVSRELSQSTFTTADIGVQVVTLTITDEFGFSSNCDGFINVFPYTAPVVPIDDPDIDLNCPTDIVVQVPPGALSTEVSWTDPVPTTNCTVTPPIGGGDPVCTTRTVSQTTQCSSNDVYSLWLDFDGLNNHYQIQNGIFTEYKDGTATLTGNAVNNSNSNIRFEVSAVFSGRTTSPPANSPKDHACDGAISSADYSYYPNFTGTLKGTNAAAGAILTLNDFSSAFQLGTGANVTGNTSQLGASGWFSVNIVHQPSGSLNLVFGTTASGGQNGDFNLMLSGDAGTCRDNGSSGCPNMSTSLSGYNYLGEHNGSRYFLSTSTANWNTANNAATNVGGHLLSVDNSTENEFIRGQLQNGSSIWMGFTDAASEGNWQWTSGDPVNLINWNLGEPNEGTGANHARMLQSNGRWTDRSASNTYYYVVEMACSSSGCDVISENISGFTYMGEFDNAKYFVSNQSSNWTNAKTTSEANGGNLVVIESAAENSFIQNNINPASGSVWTGLNNVGNGSTFQWVDGTPLAYTNWLNGEPNGSPNTHGVRLRKTQGDWTDRNISDHFEFVMEIPCGNSGGGPGEVGLTLEQISGAISGSVFPVGESEVAYRATDNCGNEEICIFNITVEANPAEIILTDCPTAVIVDAAPGAPSAQVSWVDPTATSNCFIDPRTEVEQVFGPISGSILPIGTQPVTYTVVDSCGNFSSCVFPVTVNATPAAFSLTSCPGDISIQVAAGQTSGIASWNLPTGSSDCFSAGINVDQLAGPTSGATFPLGITTVAYVLSDNCGNSELCTFTVTVTETCSAVGTPCNDGDPTTENDVEDGNCNCAGTPCPTLGTACDDGDATTENDVEDGECNCAGTPIVCPPAGTACDDGDATTENDMEDGNCNCAGTPCPTVGTACDDGDATTENDVEDGECNCAGTPIVCPPAGTACDDGDATTENDVEDGNCNCAGTPIVCPPAGTACDDGNANTENDVEDGNCNCAGTPINTGGCNVTENLAPAGTATESSEQFTATGARAIDGNTDGNFWAGNSVALTKWEAQPWIEVDLGEIANIESFNIYNRTDCCEEFLSNYHILISNVPFTSTDLAATIAQPGVIDIFEGPTAGMPTSLSAPANTTGRYVRIQLEGTSFLGLAELEIIGCTDPGSCPVAGTACDDGDATTENDVEDGNCNCAGTPIVCPPAGTACDDGDATTENDVEDGNCNCAGTPISCPAAGTSCDDGDANTENDVEDGNCNCAGTPINTGGCNVTENLAPAGTATESSEQFTATGARAIDGNTDGNFWAGNSVALTKWEAQPWIEVDLGQVSNIESFNVYNRSDCCDGFLSNYHILISNVPFTSTNLAATIAQAGVVDIFESATAGMPTSLSAPANTTGRYVRIQLEGTSFLGLAELEIIGCTGPVTCPAAGTACDDGDASTENDVEDGNCNCAGTPIACPAAGTACDDGDASTENDVEDGNCNCSGTPISCPAAGTSCDDGDANTENDVEDGNCNCAGTPINTGGCTTTSNLALNGTASQISTLSAGGITGSADKAIDGNTAGRYFTSDPSASSVTATNFGPEPWWQVDLGANYLIETINVYNRTDGIDKTNNAYILVSNTPFTSDDLTAARAQADFEMHVSGLMGSPSVALPNISGQYVRVQMAGTGYLVLAEVEVIGCSEVVPFAVPNMMNFNVVKEGRTSQVEWLMLKDVNVDVYEVEVSTDGNEFRILDVMQADRMASARDYNMIDTEPVHGYNYYRLKVNNLDGTAYYSNTRRVNFDIDFGKVTVFPNPTKDHLNVSLRDFAGKAATIEIYNSFGQKVGERKYESIPSIPASFDVSKMIGGVYTITIKIDDHRRCTKKFVISKL